MSSASTPANPCLCPLCGQPNGCAMEAAKQSGEPVARCWCVDATFSPELLARIPKAAERQACICPTCANASLNH